MKVTKKFQKTFEVFVRVKVQEKKLLGEIFEWLENQGIDVHEDEFADAFLVRLGNNELDTFEEFINDLERYKKGENVGYG